MRQRLRVYSKEGVDGDWHTTAARSRDAARNNSVAPRLTLTDILCGFYLRNTAVFAMQDSVCALANHCTVSSKAAVWVRVQEACRYGNGVSSLGVTGEDGPVPPEPDERPPQPEKMLAAASSAPQKNNAPRLFLRGRGQSSECSGVARYAFDSALQRGAYASLNGHAGDGCAAGWRSAGR